MALQSFDHQISSYERPNQPWMCGRLAEGVPCHAGPDRRGNCRGGFECLPRHVDARWECTRAPTAGGKCADGPLPNGQCCRSVTLCTPVRGLRARRARATRWLLVAMVGLLAVLIGGTGLRHFVSPGPVNFRHADVRDCTSCHAGFGAGPINWIHQAFQPVDPKVEVKRCTACHALGDNALAAHSLPPMQLAVRRKAAHPAAPWTEPSRMAAAAALFPVSTARQQTLACFTCHKEHQGPSALLTPMSDQECQACHAFKFASLAHGHPAFGEYPYLRRTRIIFDHALHFDRHFGESKAKGLPVPAGCSECHELGQRGRMEVVKPFEVSCGACHLGDIQGAAAAAAGASVFVMPGIDLKTLVKRGASIGEWPAGADSDLTPMMWLFLLADPKTAQNLIAMGDVALDDLSTADADQIKAAEAVAWAIKELIYEPLVNGVGTLEARMDKVLGANVNRSTMAGLLAGLPEQVLLDGANAWFPHLLTEIPRHRAGEKIPTISVVPGGLPPPEQPAAPAVAAALAPAPSPPAAPPPAAGQGDILGGGGGILGGNGGILGGDATAPAPPSAPAPAASPAPAAGDAPAKDQGGILGGSGGILGGGGNILGGDTTAPATAPAPPAAPAAGDAAAKDQGGILGGGGGILGGGGNILGGDASAPAPAIAPPPAPAAGDAAAKDRGGILGGGGGILGGGGNILGGDTTAPATAPAPAPAPAPATVLVASLARPSIPQAQALDPERWATFGGWYRIGYAILYRPVGHADPFMREWLDVTAPHPYPEAGGWVFRDLTAANTAGQCIKCHSIEARGAKGARQVNWRPEQDDPEARDFTTFSHTPHVGQMRDQDCTACHALRAHADVLGSYAQDDPTKFNSGFTPLKREICARCHVRGQANASCTECHNYHVGRFARGTGDMTDPNTISDQEMR